MNDDLEFLKDLPEFKARSSFEDALYGDALGIMPESSPAPVRKSVPIWASFAMAASLAMGLWIGIGQDGLLGLTSSQETTLADINVYQDMLTELSS